MGEIEQRWLPLFQQFGRDLFLSGLVSSHAGNLSVLLRDDPDHLLITRTNSMLGHLGESDLIMTGIDHDDERTKLASSEIWAHRAIYSNGKGFAVAHAHPVHAVALSYHFEQIDPINSEGKDLLGVVPVLNAKEPPGSPGRAAEIADVLYGPGGGRMMMIRGHGAFATGETLEQAYKYISCFEESCKILIQDLGLRAALGKTKTRSRGKQ